MNMKRVIGLSVVAVALASGCAKAPSSKVQQAVIAQHFALRYNVAAESLLATASLKSGEQDLQLDGASRLRFDGKPLEQKPNPLTFAVEYQLEQKKLGRGEAQAPHAFEYTNNAGESYRNEVRLPSAPSLSLKDRTVNQAQDVPAVWITFDPVAEGRIYVQARREGLAFGWFTLPGVVTFKNGDSHKGLEKGGVLIQTGKLLGAGKYLIQACREEKQTLKETTSGGGTLTLTHCGEEETLEVLR